MTSAAKAFREQFPGTPLRLFVEALGGGYKPVLNGSAGDWYSRLTAGYAGLVNRGSGLTGVSLVDGGRSRPPH
ncbi:Uncharacterised protein [Cedecea neteri]|uniref:Uncharacterized protein n=1 Tax=Cedecea neteri TaxID=158822 RepID=A0A2X3J5P6_9ENTR|nr:Uncharacterised protein [Cedecea neteri]